MVVPCTLFLLIYVWSISDVTVKSSRCVANVLYPLLIILQSYGIKVGYGGIPGPSGGGDGSSSQAGGCCS